MQPTWSKLIRLLLTAEGKNEKYLTTDYVKILQGNELARPNSNHCLLEMFPLPCPQTNEKSWKYNEYTDIDYLETRKCYEDYIAVKRIEAIRSKIKKHKPKAVIFYSTDKNKLEYWKRIVESSKDVFNIKDIEGQDTYYHNSNDIHYIVVPHPVRHGITNKYFEAVGEFIK
ncbi:MAG: hypothetical protein JJT76_14580 [Clostridiaceae bacterium]|nr:hypothetical protein [Clostridiaceae bacterium]